MVILDDDGRVSEVYAAHDSGKVVNPISIQGQIEGGVLMGMGYALTEDWPLKDCVPQARYGTLGLFRAPEIPDIHAIYVEKDELLPVAYGGKGIGEIATIPTRPPCRTPIARLTASCVRICPWWIRRTAALVTAGRVERGRPLLTAVCACHQLYSCAFGPSSIASRGLLFGVETASRIQASERVVLSGLVLNRKLYPGTRLQNGIHFPERPTYGGLPSLLRGPLVELRYS